jgi:hypothetical protein
MKLIDILVQELPKRGGWPEGAKTVAQDSCGEVWGFNCVAPKINNGLWWISASYTDLISSSRVQLDLLADDWNSTFITREQYEAALAAKNEGWIEWGGGECPVSASEMVDVIFWHGGRMSTNIADYWRWNHNGTDSDIIAYRLHQPQEITEADDEADLNECIGQDVAPVWNGEGLPPVGCECEMQDGSGYWIAVDIIANKDGFTFGWSYDYRMVYFSDKENEFRPSRSEADKKRDEAVAVMLSVFGSNAATGTKAALKAIYDAIAVGKVRGVKLED